MKLSLKALAISVVACPPAAAQQQFDVPMPAVTDRSTFITQIGESNRAETTQTAADASVSVRQQGADNRATVMQRGGLGFIDLRQTGDANTATLTQDGTGGNALYVAQTGNGNEAVSVQTAAASTTARS